MIQAVSILLVHASLVGVALAALFQVDVSTSIRILLFVGLGFLVLAVKILFKIQENLDRLFVVLRLVFVSTESLRLDAEDREPAVDKLARDVSSENSNEQISKLLSGNSISSFLFWAINLIIMFVVAFVSIEFWLDAPAA